MNYILLKAERSLQYYRAIIAREAGNNVFTPELPVSVTIPQKDDENG